MFEEMTYEALMKRALARVPAALDKREGSMVFNGVAPAMAETAQLYMGLDFVFRATYLLTAPREYLILRAADRGLAPRPASAAVYRAELDRAVPAGTRFSCEEGNFVVTGLLEGTEDRPGTVSHRVTCEAAGTAGNRYAGPLIPIEYVDGLTRAELAELLIPGEDEEETEAFRRRVLDSFRAQSFGGNRADYREKALAIPGVGAVKVEPVWNGDIRPGELIPDEETAAWYESAVGTLAPGPAAWLTAVYRAAADRLLTVGGCVRLVVMAADHTPPTQALLDEVQARMDPTQNAGEGLGLAPIGHVVRVDGVTRSAVDLELRLTYAPGWSWEGARSYVEGVIDGYFSELAQTWAGSDFLVVRISQVESRILSGCSAMVTDVGGTKLNGAERNLTLDGDSIPVRGEVRG